MKTVVGILLLVVVATVAKINSDKKSLSGWYMDTLKTMNAIKSDNKFYTFTSKLNLRCITQQLDFSINREKQLNFAEAMILLYGSGLKCMDELKRKNAWKMMIDNLIDTYVFEDDIQCFKMELKRLDPDSQFVSNFDESLMTISNEDCEQIVDMDGLEIHLDNVEKEYGLISDISQTTFDREDFKKVLLTMIVLGKEDDKTKSTPGRNELIAKLQYSLDTAVTYVLYKLSIPQNLF